MQQETMRATWIDELVLAKVHAIETERSITIALAAIHESAFSKALVEFVDQSKQPLRKLIQLAFAYKFVAAARTQDIATATRDATGFALSLWSDTLERKIDEFLASEADLLGNGGIDTAVEIASLIPRCVQITDEERLASSHGGGSKAIKQIHAITLQRLSPPLTDCLAPSAQEIANASTRQNHSALAVAQIKDRLAQMRAHLKLVEDAPPLSGQVFHTKESQAKHALTLDIGNAEALLVLEEARFEAVSKQLDKLRQLKAA